MYIFICTYWPMHIYKLFAYFCCFNLYYSFKFYNAFFLKGFNVLHWFCVFLKTTLIQLKKLIFLLLLYCHYYYNYHYQ